MIKTQTVSCSNMCGGVEVFMMGMMKMEMTQLAVDNRRLKRHVSHHIAPA